jgi:hypothetical protein
VAPGQRQSTNFTGKQKAISAPEPGPADKPTKAGDTITISQVKAVAQMVKAVGGFDRLNGLLGLIREIGGMKKFKDLLEATLSSPSRECSGGGALDHAQPP